MKTNEAAIEEAIKLLKANGYNVIKRKPYVKLMPCVCGCKKPEEWYKTGNGDTGPFYRCPNCKLEGGIGRSNRESREKWNEAVEKAMVEKEK